MRKERKIKKTKLKLKPKSKTEVKVKVKVKKENGSTELEEGEIKDPPKRPIPPPLPFDPPKPLDSYEYKGPLGRGQRREEMVKRGKDYVFFLFFSVIFRIALKPMD